MEKRWIDANELIQNRPENLNEKYTTELIAAHHKGWNECNKAWLKIIESQPTAYSIDEIVKQLEKESWRNCCYSRTSALIDLDDAIEIVKSGAE